MGFLYLSYPLVKREQVVTVMTRWQRKHRTTVLVGLLNDSLGKLAATNSF